MSIFRRDQVETAAAGSGLLAEPAIFPADLLEALEHTWGAICDAYDAVADLPEAQTLFAGVDLTAPEQAAESVLARMLLEAMYGISRYSPWYKRPLGLLRLRDEATGRCRWALSPETRRQWQGILSPLAAAIRSNVGVVLAADLLDGLEEEEALPADCVMAVCQCAPARAIRVRRVALASANIVCGTCQQPFRPVEAEDPGGWDNLLR